MNKRGNRRDKRFLINACAATAAMAAGPSVVNADSQPTPAETAATRHALGKDYAGTAPCNVGHANLNDDLIVPPTVHKGMHGFKFDGAMHQFMWTGTGCY